jgi:hypothetical protein
MVKPLICFRWNIRGVWKHGYVPTNLFFGEGQYGDYIELEFCADCGQIQSKFPISTSKIQEAMDGLNDDGDL